MPLLVSGRPFFLSLLVLMCRGAVSVLIIIFLENAREFPETITNTSAKFGESSDFSTVSAEMMA